MTISEDSPTSVRASLRRIRAAGLLVVFIGLAGFLAAAYVERHGMNEIRPLRFNVFHYLYALAERPFFLLLVLFGLLVVVWPARRLPLPADAPRRLPTAVLAAISFAIAAAVLVTSWIGTHRVIHDAAVSMDEFASTFQARIFARGRLEGEIPEAWHRFGVALTPVFIEYKRSSQTWIETYLPVYAGIRALFQRLGIEQVTNAILAFASLLLMAAIGRRLWPDDDARTLLAILFLATSSQYLLTSMTAYAMPAHLFFSLLWLLLYLRGDRASWIALPWVGVLALGVHHPFPHALFAAPFLVRWLLRRRDRWLAYISAVYGIGVLGWVLWLRYTQPYVRGGRFWSLFSFPLPDDLFLQFMHLTIVFSWQSPIVPILLLIGIFRIRSLPEPVRDLAIGLALTFLFYCLFPLGQGHGWGYRYIYGALGNLVILAVYGLSEASARLRRTRVLVAASLFVAVLFQIPARAAVAERFVRPFARTQAYLASLRGCVVLIDPAMGWYLQDLIRNDPFLENDPKILFADRLRPFQRAALEERFPGAVRELTREELLALGFPGVSAPSARRPESTRRR